MRVLPLIARCLTCLTCLTCLSVAGCGRTQIWTGNADAGAKPQEICGNGVDDDGNGLTDCQDPRCAGALGCAVTPELCDNSIDDDGDGQIDCQDPDCLSDPACLGKVELCGNGIDDDGDGLTDCQDPKCVNDPACSGKHELCDNGVDDDGDGRLDCEDPDCKSLPGCKQKEDCTNGVDDDGDGKLDCDDPDCFTHPHCKVPGKEVCTNGLDDDEDGEVDCADLDCKNDPICQPGQEVCDNGVDDDGDGAIDCADPDCKGFPACLDKLCKPAVDFGTLQAKGSSVTRTAVTTATKDYYTSPCVQPGGGEVVTRFTLAAKSDVKLSYVQSGGDHVFGLFRAGLAEACNANPVSCYDPKSVKSGSFSLLSLGAGTYYLFVEAFAKGLEGSVEVTLSTGPATGQEVCNNGVDDDGDGAVDCADLDCFLEPACQSQTCGYDVNLGALVINGPGKSTTVVTTGAPNHVDEACGGGGAGDRIIRFVMPAAAGLTVEMTQSGWHVLGLHHDLGPGTKCNADAGECYDSNKLHYVGLVYGDLEKGVYYYIVDALNKSSEGTVDLTFHAVANRGPELCADGVDNDGDGLVDCLDPDCFTFPTCPGPPCQPDFAVAPLPPNGPLTSLTVDTTKGSTGAILPCALGGGKAQVIELTLTEVSGLAIACDDTGDHVFGLFAPVQPRDACDQHLVNCADPKIGALGCNFIMPNLQPGTYYLIVQAFKKGAEGTVNLTVAATPDHAQEICNNGIDDDGNGLTDCQDLSCADKPICQGKACVPHVKAGLLPGSGSPVSAAITTMGAKDSFSTTCGQGGGPDGVVSFSLAAPANLQVDYAQFGDHVLGLFDSKNTALPCDVSQRQCQATSGQPMGQLSFSSLPAGDYSLIVEALSPGDVGSVVLKLSAK